VLFHARIFERGEDRSFSELSTFVREDGAWRYASGVSLPAAELPPAPRGGGEATRLDREGFLALVDLRELRAGHATDDEIEGLLERVYVGGGFTEPGRAAAQFRGPAVRARGEILAVRAPGGDLAGMAVVVHPASPGRRIARPDEAELQLLAVDAVHRGHGTGERLVRAAIAAARQRGLARLVLWTRPVMRDARRLYDRLGFVPEPDRDFERDGRAFVVLVAEL
jgi:GNAT superfamily N-acetyltransferase